ncbi:MAG: hypothetical protein HQK59_17745, partial [Deltaproteobacteria bacterium]|nr:hypothetical protein [Deltaproteobacteria bacterium]
RVGPTLNPESPGEWRHVIIPSFKTMIWGPALAGWLCLGLQACALFDQGEVAPPAVIREERPVRGVGPGPDTRGQPGGGTEKRSASSAVRETMGPGNWKLIKKAAADPVILNTPVKPNDRALAVESNSCSARSGDQVIFYEGVVTRISPDGVSIRLEKRY